jgi:hypothetical protein
MSIQMSSNGSATKGQTDGLEREREREREREMRKEVTARNRNKFFI